ncbi:hypothetical protein ETD83_41300, partial [Actinomadura soli]
MATHVIPAPTAPPTARPTTAPTAAPSGTGTGTAPTAPASAPGPAYGAVPVTGAWLPLSAAFTDAVTDLTDREDLTVRCAPGLGRGAPGCYVPSLAAIELDGIHLGQQPGTCDPTRPADRERYPALWGVLTHEAAHATHTRWTIPGDASAAAAQAALALEESRIEVAQIRRRPADRRWIRACVTRLVFAEFTSPTAPPAATSATTPPAASSGTPPVTTPNTAMTPWNAGYAAALLLARTDAGILKPAETGKLAAAVLGVLGPTRLSALSALWHLAHATRDDDADTMMDLARRWCRILDVNPDRPA